MLTRQLSEIQDKLEAKVNCSQVDTLEKIVQSLDARVNDGYKGKESSSRWKSERLTLLLWLKSLSWMCQLYRAVLRKLCRSLQRVQSLEEKREEKDREKTL